MHIFRSLIVYILISGLLLFTACAHAISFGDIKVYSYLDEPLNAELELTELNGLDPNLLLVGLASANDFVRANLERPFFLTTLTFEVFTFEDRVFVSIKSTKVVKSPYLELLIKFEWPTGSFIKDYTILLDPPPKDLNSATRPVPYSKQAEKQTGQKLFPSDIQKQAEKKAAAKAATTPAATPNTAAQATTQQTAGVAPAVSSAQQPTQAVTQPAATIPGQQSAQTVAPSVATPTAQQPAQATTQPATTSQTVPAQSAPTTQSTTASAPGTATTQQRTQNAQPAPPSGANPAANAPPAKTNFQKEIDRQQAQHANESLLDTTIDEIKDLHSLTKGSQTDLQHLAAERQKHLDMYKDVNDNNDEPEIDFGDIIKPGAAPTAARAVPGAVPGSSPSVSPPVSPPRTSGALQLLLTGFLLGAIAVVGIGLKKGWHKKLLSRHTEPVETISRDDQTFEEEFDFDHDTENNMAHLAPGTEVQEIEITGLPKKENDHLNLDEFERELAGLSAEHGASAVVPKAPVKTMTDLLNISDLIQSDETSVAPAPKSAATPQPIAAPQIVAPQVTAPQTMPQESTIVAPQIATAEPKLETSLAAAKQDPDAPLAFDTQEINKILETAAQVAPAPAPAASATSVAEENFDFDAVSIEMAQDVQATPEKPDLSKDVIDDIQITDVVVPKPVIDNEPAIATPQQQAAAAAPAPAPAPAPAKMELHLVDENPKQAAAATVDQESTLRLEPEGAPLITAEEEAIKLKIDLAKKYLDAGDKETAKNLLHEVLKTAKDNQKLEAEIILSGIL